MKKFLKNLFTNILAFFIAGILLLFMLIIGIATIASTDSGKDIKIEAEDFIFIREALDKINAKLIAEGNINTPQKLKRVMELGVYSAVVGSSITRPQLITKSFTSVLK